MNRGIPKIVASLLMMSIAAQAEPLPDVSPKSVGMSSDRLGRIVPVMQGYVDRGEVSGITTAVTRHGKIVHMESVGLRDIESKLAMTRDTIFRIYSMAKPITAVAAMILYEEGKFKLTDPVADYLPQFEDVKVYVSGTVDSLELIAADPVPTIHDLLRHTSGLTYGGEKTAVNSLYGAADLWNRELTLEQQVAKLADLPLQHQPGTAFEYSMSFDVLGLLVQVISGQPFEIFLEERIFAPLGMVDTGFYVPKNKLDRFAINYQWTDEETLKPVDEDDPPEYTVPPKRPGGGGGLVSTVDDYLRFCQMMLNGGELDGQRVLMPATVRFMRMNHLKPDQEMVTGYGPGGGYGLGFAVLLNPAMNGRIGNVGEVAWGGLAKTFFWIDPKEDLVYMVWTQLFRSGIPDFVTKMHPLVHAALLK